MLWSVVMYSIPKIIFLAGLTYPWDAVFKWGSFCIKRLGRFTTDFTALLSFGGLGSRYHIAIGQYADQFLNSAHAEP